MFNFIKEQACYYLVKKLIGSNKAVKFYGPYAWKEGRAKDEIEEFLIRENAIKAPHLNSKSTRAIEENLDINKRSAHFVARSQGKVIAYVRLTPKQFELEKLSPKFDQLTRPLGKYWEISRLNTDSQLANKSQIAGLLMLKAGLWLFSKRKGLGLVGVCTPNRVGFFTRFGMRSLDTDELRGRVGKYHLVFASKSTIITEVLYQFFARPQFVKGAFNVHRTVKRKA